MTAHWQRTAAGPHSTIPAWQLVVTLSNGRVVSGGTHYWPVQPTQARANAIAARVARLYNVDVERKAAA